MATFTSFVKAYTLCCKDCLMLNFIFVFSQKKEEKKYIHYKNLLLIQVITTLAHTYNAAVRYRTYGWRKHFKSRGPDLKSEDVHLRMTLIGGRIVASVNLEGQARI